MRLFLYIVPLFLLTACGTNRSGWSPNRKYAPAQLQKDYAIYRSILEEAHPSLYWYTSKDSMDRYFDWGRNQINDSLTETDFRKVLGYVTSHINCGHTSIRSSKKYSHYQDTARLVRIFPLSMKAWNDTMVVAANLHRKDSVLTRGVVVTSINAHSTKSLLDTMFTYIGTDGYNSTHKYQSISNRGAFGSLYSSLYGNDPYYTIDFIDSAGRKGTTRIRPYYPAADTLLRSALKPVTKVPQPSKKERSQMRMNNVRLLKVDSAEHVAMMDLNSFSRGFGLKNFFKRSFRNLNKLQVKYLIIDVRGNGGGSVTNSTTLTRYMSDHSFVVADSLYAITRSKKYSRYIESDFWNRLFMVFFTPRKSDGNYHFRYFERHRFKPKKKNHFEGKVYILTGGNSFSATTLFAGELIDQANVTVVGEETGGGSYGNSAWLIPDVKLPETGVRFRLPLFRLVIDKNKPKTGKGVQPEVFSGPTVEAIRRGADYKLEQVMALIKADKASAQ